MSSNAMQASPEAYQSPHYKSQRNQLYQWAMEDGYSERGYNKIVEKVEGTIRNDRRFATMVEEWIQYNIDHYVYFELFGDRYGPCTFVEPTCPEDKPIHQGNGRGGLSQRGRGGNTSRGGWGGSGYQSQGMSTNMPSPMTQPGFGGSYYSIPTSQRIGMETEEQGYGGGGFGGHPGQGGFTNADQQGLNEPPARMMGNMSSGEEVDEAEQGNETPAGKTVGPRGAQRDEPQGGAQTNQAPKKGGVRQPMLGVRQGVPRFSVEATSGLPVGSKKYLFTLFREDARAVQQTIFGDAIRLTWWNSKGDHKEPENRLFFLAEPKSRNDMKEFDKVRELLRAHKALTGWVCRMCGSTPGVTEFGLRRYCADQTRSDVLSYPKVEEVQEQIIAFLQEENKAAEAESAIIEQELQAARARALKASKKEEEKVVEDEIPQEERMFRDPTTGEMVTLSELVRRSEWRGYQKEKALRREKDEKKEG